MIHYIAKTKRLVMLMTSHNDACHLRGVKNSRTESVFSDMRLCQLIFPKQLCNVSNSKKCSTRSSGGLVFTTNVTCLYAPRSGAPYCVLGIVVSWQVALGCGRISNFFFKIRASAPGGAFFQKLPAGIFFQKAPSSSRHPLYSSKHLLPEGAFSQ